MLDYAQLELLADETVKLRQIYVENIVKVPNIVCSRCSCVRLQERSWFLEIGLENFTPNFESQVRSQTTLHFTSRLSAQNGGIFLLMKRAVNENTIHTLRPLQAGALLEWRIPGRLHNANTIIRRHGRR